MQPSIGIVTNAMFALASPSSGASLLGITEGDLLLIGFVSLSTLTTMFLMYRPLLFSTFDQEAARVLGIRTASVQLIFSLLLTLIIIASMNIVGVTMIAATLITPAATARLMTDCFSRMLIYALIIGGITGVAGMYLSYIFNLASGATIVLFGASLYCLSWLTNFLHDRYILQNHLDGHSIKALNETRLDFKSDLDQCACHRK
ncbi:MAG: hypothetical protein K0S36_2150 [Nitrosospira multiformis]|jgi:manganese/iron transport system permease protein/iron/zinc/copper transport system permease protein|nr:hypothetical protein [Nitrosospira multiformis]